MKKFLTIIVSLVLVFTLSACKEDDIVYDIATPSISVEGDLVTILMPSNETTDYSGVTFTVFIDDVTGETVSFKEEVSSTWTYTLPTLEDNKLYEVRVQAKNGEKISTKSNAVKINTFDELDKIYATYNTLESSPVTILGVDSNILYITYGKLNNSKLNGNDYEVENGVLSLTHSNLSNTSTLTFYIFTADGYYPCEVNKVDLEVPSIYSESTVTFASMDLYFQFNFAGGEFVEISGSDISSSDYELIGNTLVVEKEFIQDLFDSNSERDTVILSYQLKTDDDIIIGYLFIQK